MDMACSTDGSAVAIAPAGARGRLIHWAVLGAAGVIALILALSHSMAASAAAPVTYDTNCIAINYTTCVPTVGYIAPANGTIAPGFGAFNGNVVNVTVDARYCNGIVYVVNEGGNLIDRCPNGARVFPAFPDFGIGGVIGTGFIGANFNNGVVVNNGIIGNGAICNGVFGCPGVFNNFAGCNVNFNCGAFPAGATYVGGGVYTYRDNRFCGDGNLAFVVGRGFFCQNGQPLFANGNVVNPVVVRGNFYRFYEATPPTAVTHAPAAPVAPAATVTQPAAAPAPAAPQQAPAQVPTALTAPQVQAPAAGSASGSVHALSAAPATAPTATKDTDDHKG